ncbi:hypothetical protein HMPREF3289_00230 [Pseudomonas sp. HMSC75E02]|nr:hypothetical protein HMPREF3289_00230 [Pseudomonas sp. HMSC75E02]
MGDTIFGRQASIEAIFTASWGCRCDIDATQLIGESRSDEDRPLNPDLVIYLQIMVISDARGLAHHGGHFQ